MKVYLVREVNDIGEEVTYGAFKTLNKAKIKLNSFIKFYKRLGIEFRRHTLRNEYIKFTSKEFTIGIEFIDLE